MPDARRVAPISVCVSSSAKCYHQTLALMGDASRVGIEIGVKYDCYYC